jgi:hypothetical protein
MLSEAINYENLIENCFFPAGFLKLFSQIAEKKEKNNFR